MSRQLTHFVVCGLCVLYASICRSQNFFPLLYQIFELHNTVFVSFVDLYFVPKTNETHETKITRCNSLEMRNRPLLFSPATIIRINSREIVYNIIDDSSSSSSSDKRSNFKISIRDTNFIASSRTGI